MEDVILKRKIYDKMLKWKSTSKRETALLLDGVRRVGKSFIATLFAKKYKAILFGNLNINEGIITENIVAQTLRSNGNKLYFYSRSDTNNRENHMKIDFVISEGRKMMPIEVKSSSFVKHVSLDKFMEKFKGRYNKAYIIYEKDLKKMTKSPIFHYICPCSYSLIRINTLQYDIDQMINRDRTIIF